jgi:hypothetical protein
VTWLARRAKAEDSRVDQGRREGTLAAEGGVDGEEGMVVLRGYYRFQVRDEQLGPCAATDITCR